MAAVDAAEAVVPQMPVEPPPIAAGAVVERPEPPQIVADAVVEPPPVAADAAVEPIVEPPPIAANAVVERPPPIAADAMETVGTPPPEAADDEEAAAAPMSAVLLPPPPPPLEQKAIQKQPEETVQPSEHLQVEEQLAMDNDDLSDDSPTRNSNDDSDHSDDGCYRYYDPINCWHDPYYRVLRDRRRNYGYPCISNAGRNRWHGGHPFAPDLTCPCNPMASRDTEPWSQWPSPEPDIGKIRHNTYTDTSYVSRWSSSEPDCRKERYSVGAGLSNPRWWTCFLNCILQCMVHTVPLVLRLRIADHPDPCPRASVRFCCFCSLKLHVDESIRLSGSAFYPENFVNHLKLISPNFESGVQQDAQEFLCDLLEKLDEASVAPKSSLEEPSSTEGGIAKEIFGGRLKSQLRCPQCNRCSDKSEPFLDLSLEVTMVESLMDALQSFTKVELIEDYMCDGCKSRVNMEKHFKVEQAPEVLVIHLKRFTNSGGKICDKVKYPLELEMDSFMSSSDDTQKKYDLYGVVVHHGIYGRGHYVCYIRSSVDDWYEFNDDKIFRCSEASVLDSAAYLLFYVKQGSSPWFSTLLEKEDKCQQDGSVSLAEQGVREIALIDNKEEKLTSRGLGDSGHCLVGPAEENGNLPSLSDFSQDIQWNGNDNALLDAADKLEEGCCLDAMSGGVQELSCLIGPGNKNGHADEFLEPWEMEDAWPGGSLDMEEINPSTRGSSEVDPTEPHGASRPKRESIFSVQLSHYDDKPREKEDVGPEGPLDTKEMNPITHGSLEVGPAVTQGGSLSKTENTCSLLQLAHMYDNKPWKKEDVSPRGSLETKEMSLSTHGSSEVDPTVTQGGSPPKNENFCSLLQQSLKYDDNCHCRNFSSQDETGGCSGAPSMGMCTSENETVESKSNPEFQDSEDEVRASAISSSELAKSIPIE